MKRCLSPVALLFALLWQSLAGAAVLTDAQREAAIVALSERIEEVHPGARYEVALEPLDSRIRLQPCNSLTFEVRASRYYGRVPIQVRCRAPVVWAIFLAANVTLWQDVVILQQSLGRDERLTASSIAVESRPRASLRTGFLSNTRQALGMQLRRPLSAGEVLYQNQVTAPLAITRGERIALRAGRQRVAIQVAALALESGRIGDQIRVRNLDSERVVRAWIAAPGQVSSTPPTGQTGNLR